MAKKQKPQPITGFTFELSGFEWKMLIQDVVEGIDSDKVWGSCDPDKREICITRHPDKEFMRITFFHEFFHACVSAIHISGSKNMEDKVYEEHAAELFGQGMTQLVRQIHILPAWVFNRGNV